MSNIDAAKSLLIQAQRGYDTEEIVNVILKGKEELWTAGEIASRLKVSTDTFNKWVKNGDPKYRPTTKFSNFAARVIGVDPIMEALENAHEDSGTVFPSPDFYIGAHPRWTTTTFRNWLRAEIKKAG